VEAVSIGPVAEADSVIWTAKLRTGRVVTFRASDSRAFRAAALIALVEAAGLVAIDSVAAGDSAAIASVVAVDSAAGALGALADSAVAADSGADDEN
jgi:hypothetical protein